ncbi:MAG: EAL domain-containing protein [Lachnospiraceae bacterium]|nr:EAL domain-containing protein [Lachnospiraceae bacterium]
MDFKAVAESMSAMTCIVSVEKLPGGRRGKFCIVAGNKAYIDSIEHPAPGAEMLTDKFVPGAEYTDYLTRDLNFEDYCYGAAVEKKLLHSYAHPDRMDIWFNMLFIPLDADEGNLSYCMYMMEINFEASSERLSSISGETASSVLDTCIKLRGTNDFKATMKDVVAGIRDLCDAEQCCILVLNDIERTCSVLGEAFRDKSDMLPMETYLDEDFYDIAESWTATIAGSNCIIAKNDQDMEIIKERNPVWHKSLSDAGVNNIILFPLKSRNQLLGYIWAINFDETRAIKIKEMLEVSTFILGSELGNYLLLDRLRFIASKDILTGVMNRNEMNNYVDELSHGSSSDASVAVLFADLNGLKTVNDHEGHNAGDLLLKNAASVLKSVFDEKEIFRAGGDEFAVIVTGLTEEDLLSRIETIRRESEKFDNLSFAIGGCVEDNSGNIRLALRCADERMYEDKRRFYEQYPELISNDRRRKGTVPTDVSAANEDDYREQTLFREMNYDFLTGLSSMTYFFKLAESARNSMHGQNIPTVIVYLNLNGMRFFNKRFGFAEGDILIKEFAKILSHQFGDECCSRFGQDRFAIFTEAKDVERKLKRVFKEMKTANGGKTLPVRAGIYPDSMGLVEASLACDRAKYACHAVRDANDSYFNYFDKKMLDRELNTQYIVDNIDRALAENWITAYYQPIVRATSRKVCDEEALARWIDPEKGMLSPADFIPILEDTRLIYKVDLRIVDIILERIKKQSRSGMPVVPISINLSRTDFECCDIVEEICNRADAADVPRELITVEITESVIGQNLDFMKSQIARFQELGFKVWMDDFGSGYSSLDLLQEMQFDLIKFDMRFMRQFDSSTKSRVLLTELMRMAISLNIETVVEGVETAEQVEFLSEIGCTKMQGYYFNKPVSYEQIIERYSNGTQIGFENPDEAEYFMAMGSINLYDLGAVSSEEGESLKHYFNTIPMAVIESDGVEVKVSRANKSYRDFVKDHRENAGDAKLDVLLESIRKCRDIGQKVFINEVRPDRSTVNALIRRIADDPVNGLGAFAVAILDVRSPSGVEKKKDE